VGRAAVAGISRFKELVDRCGGRRFAKPQAEFCEQREDLAAPLAGRACYGRKMEKLSLQLAIAASALDSYPRRAAASARANGFGGLQFDAISAQLDLTELSQTGRREFRQMLASNNVALAALRADFGPKGLAPGVDVDRLLARMAAVMDATKALVVPPLLCLDLGPLPEPPAEEKPRPRVTPEQAGLIIIPSFRLPRRFRGRLGRYSILRWFRTSMRRCASWERSQIAWA